MFKNCVVCGNSFEATANKKTCSIICSKELEKKRDLAFRKKWILEGKAKNYQRKFQLVQTVNGKNIKIRVLKRDYPKDNCCELCSAQKRLVYHHWRIENQKAYGLWICGFCHKFAEIFDKKNELVKKYEELKKKIEFEFT